MVDRLIVRREAAGAQGDNLLSRLLSALDPDTGDSWLPDAGGVWWTVPNGMRRRTVQ